MSKKIKITCKQCGNVFEDYKSNKRTFCSRVCSDKGREKNGLSGEEWYKAMAHVDMGKAWRGKKNPGLSERMKGKLPWNTGLTRETDERLDRISKMKEGIPRTDIVKRKISKNRKGKNKGPRNTNDIRKIRLGNIQYIERIKLNGGQLIPRYNISSIPIIEQKAKELGITDLQHAENGGEYYIKELGYWVDGYSKEKNIVIEYVEKWHKRQTKKDMRRQNEITNLLKCEFIIITE